MNEIIQELEHIERSAIRRLLMFQIRCNKRKVCVSAIHKGICYELLRCPSSNNGQCEFSYVFRSRPSASV